MIIIWDSKAGRRDFLELILKQEGFELFSCSVFSHDNVALVKELNPKLIICSDDLRRDIEGSFEKGIIKTLGKEYELPIDPLTLLKEMRVYLEKEEL